MKSTKPTGVKEKKKKSVVAFIAVVMAVIIAAVSVFAYFSLSKPDETKLPFVYYTKDKLYACKNITKNTKSYLICDKFAGEYEFSDNGEYIIFAKNGKKSEDEALSYDLYFKKVFDKNDVGTPLAKGITDFRKIPGESVKVWFEKNNSIYLSDSSGKTKTLQKGAKAIAYSPEEELILTSNAEENEKTTLTLINLESQKLQKISDKIEEYAYTPSLSAVYFIEENNLCSAKFGSGNKTIEKNKGAKNIVCADGKLYYLLPDKSFGANAFVEDNCAESDEKATEPDWNDYLPNEADYVKKHYDSYWKSSYTETDLEAFDRDYRKAEAKFGEAMDEYNKAKQRIVLRGELKKSKDFITSYALYCYSGIRQKVSDNMVEISGIDGSEEGFARVNATTFKTPLDKLKKIDIKKIAKPEDVEPYVDKTVEFNANTVEDSKLSEFGEKDENISIKFFDSEIKKYIISKKGKDGFDLYSMKDGEAFNKAELVSENCERFSFIEEKFAVFDSYNEETDSYSLHYNKKDVAPVHGELLTDAADKNEKNIKDKKENIVFYYASDYNKDNKSCNIYKYENGKTTKLLNKVYGENTAFGKVEDKYIYIDLQSKKLMFKHEDKAYEIAEHVKGFDNTDLTTVKTYKIDGE